MLSGGYSRQFQELDAAWAQAEQNPLVQDYAIDAVDKRLAKPGRAPEGYSATAVAIIASSSFAEMRTYEDATVVGAGTAQSDVHTAYADVVYAEQDYQWYGGNDAYMQSQLGKAPDPAAVQARQNKVDAAQQELDGATMALDALEPTKRHGDSLLATRDVLARGALLLAMAPGAAVLGGGYTGFFLYADAQGAHVDRVGAHDTTDANVPGAYEVFPDVPEGSKVVQNPDGTYTITTTLTQAEQGTRALNEYAPTCELTGTEKKADEAAARSSLQIIKDATGGIKSVKVTKAKVTGFSSDEAAGPGVGLGIPNELNDCLSGKRADVGNDALTNVANEMDVTLPEIEKTHHEVILHPNQIAHIDELADKEHLSRSGLINNYNGARNKLDESTIKDMDTPFAGNRGMAVELTVERVTETTVPHTQPEKQEKWTDDFKHYKIGGLSFAWILGGTAAIMGGILGAPFAGRIGDRLARRRANNIMARAQRAAAKLAK